MVENTNASPENQKNPDFENAINWLKCQDIGTKNAFRQKLISFMDSKRGIKFDQSELDRFVETIESYDFLKETTRNNAIETFKRYMDELVGSTRHHNEDGMIVRSFEQDIRDLQAVDLIDKSLNPDIAKKNLIIIQSNPDTEAIADLITDLKIETYQKYLLEVEYGEGPSIEKIAKSLKEADEKVRRAFFLGNEKAKLFTDEEIEQIKSEILRLDDEAKKRGVEPL